MPEIANQPIEPTVIIGSWDTMPIIIPITDTLMNVFITFILTLSLREGWATTDPPLPPYRLRRKIAVSNAKYDKAR